MIRAVFLGGGGGGGGGRGWRAVLRGGGNCVLRKIKMSSMDLVRSVLGKNWSSSFSQVFPSTCQKERDQYSPIRTEQARSIKVNYYGSLMNLLTA